MVGSTCQGGVGERRRGARRRRRRPHDHDRDLEVAGARVAMAVSGVNLSGDDQADRSVHGGARTRRSTRTRGRTRSGGRRSSGRELEAGNFGENLTLDGVHVPGVVVGEHWRVGSAVLEVSEPRFPCFKLGLRMGDPGFVKRFAKARRTGTYLRIVEEGDVGAGDRIEHVERPGDGVTIGEFAEAYLGDHGWRRDCSTRRPSRRRGGNGPRSEPRESATASSWSSLGVYGPPNWTINAICRLRWRAETEVAHGRWAARRACSSATSSFARRAATRSCIGSTACSSSSAASSVSISPATRSIITSTSSRTSCSRWRL